jgi:hypothetical protein
MKTRTCRFLPEWDNLLLAHADRSRVIHADHRKGLVTKNLLIPASFLVDGFVAGLWAVENTVKAKKRHVRLVLKPFVKLDKRTRRALEEEGGQLLRFIEPDAATHTV